MLILYAVKGTWEMFCITYFWTQHMWIKTASKYMIIFTQIFKGTQMKERKSSLITPFSWQKTESCGNLQGINKPDIEFS